MVKRRAKRYSRGVALLATMLSIALMTLLVIDFTNSSALGYRSAANQANELRAYFFSKSAVEVGLAMLERSAMTDSVQSGGGTKASTGHDSLDQIWARPTPPIPLDGGFVTQQIVDDDRKVNINLFYNPQSRSVDPIWGQVIERLLANIGVSMDLLPILQDWLDPDSIETAGGAESDYYLKLLPPYEPRNGQMPTIYDLRLLKGVDDVTFFKLMQVFTAAPTQKVNINTASPEVLAALSPQLENDPNLVKTILAARMVAPFTDTGKLQEMVPDLTDYQKLQSLLTVTSTYFTITGEGDFAGARKRIYSTFKRISMQPRGAGFILASWHED
ncbi:MAG TPA: type II secretion system minor pseudopilin GspK [Candidatus Binataceae bacterium]|nr:type II secretion system minor pseudopilin GspK [Candidatus Binataceae bacterium]